MHYFKVIFAAISIKRFYWFSRNRYHSKFNENAGFLHLSNQKTLYSILFEKILFSNSTYAYNTLRRLCSKYLMEIICSLTVYSRACPIQYVLYSATFCISSKVYLYYLSSTIVIPFVTLTSVFSIYFPYYDKFAVCYFRNILHQEKQFFSFLSKLLS